MPRSEQKKAKKPTKDIITDPESLTRTDQVFALLGACWYVWQTTTCGANHDEIFQSLGLNVEYSKNDLIETAGELLHPRFKN